MKRFLALVLLSATILGSSFLLSSCSSKTYNGIFYYKVNRNNTVCIESLTPKGKELQSLTIPDKIDGYPVCQVGFHPPLLDASFYSDNLQRIYLPNTVIKFYISIDGKIISMNSNIDEDSTFCNPYFNQIVNIESNYAEVLPDKYANVAYLYNYDGAPNSGIYFLYDYDNEPILYPPESTPVRDGYAFAGWYKEKDCIIPWDFTTDIIPSYAAYQVFTITFEFDMREVYDGYQYIFLYTQKGKDDVGLIDSKTIEYGGSGKTAPLGASRSSLSYNPAYCKLRETSYTSYTVPPVADEMTGKTRIFRLPSLADRRSVSKVPL